MSDLSKSAFPGQLESDRREAQSHWWRPVKLWIGLASMMPRIGGAEAIFGFTSDGDTICTGSKKTESRKLGNQLWRADSQP